MRRAGASAPGKAAASPPVAEPKTPPAAVAPSKAPPAAAPSKALPASSGRARAADRPTVVMRSLVSHGYGCGGHCAFNWRGQSTVRVTWTRDGQARVSDRGTLERSESDPGEYRTTTRTWNFEWTGTWSGNHQQRTVKARQATSSCDVSVASGNHNGKKACSPAPRMLKLVCDWRKISIDDQHGAADAGPSAEAAWRCRSDPALAHYTGTDPPWVFGRPELERRKAGEPFPQTSYVPWRAPAAAARDE